MKRIPLVDINRQYKILQKALDAASRRVMRSGIYVLGKEVEAFEHEFSSYCHVKYAVGVASGLDALTIALRALEIGHGDEVITVAHTFMATAQAIRAVGATPIFIDVEPNTLLIDPNILEQKITKQTKAILPVQLYGSMANMDALNDISIKNKLFIIEDACQAHGSLYKNKHAGSIGHIGCFSFYPSKNLGAYGDGGMIVTQFENIAKKVKILRNVGQIKKNVHVSSGYTSRLDEIQAAMLRVKLPYLDQWNSKRNDHAKTYIEMLSGLPIEIVQVPKNVVSNYHLFVIKTKLRNQLISYLDSCGISTGVHYPTPIHIQLSMKEYGYQEGDLPITESASRQIVSLPMFSELKEAEIRRVAKIVRIFFNTNK